MRLLGAQLLRAPASCSAGGSGPGSGGSEAAHAAVSAHAPSSGTEGCAGDQWQQLSQPHPQQQHRAGQWQQQQQRRPYPQTLLDQPRCQQPQRHLHHQDDETSAEPAAAAQTALNPCPLCGVRLTQAQLQQHVEQELLVVEEQEAAAAAAAAGDWEEDWEGCHGSGGGWRSSSGGGGGAVQQNGVGLCDTGGWGQTAGEQGTPAEEQGHWQRQQGREPLLQAQRGGKRPTAPAQPSRGGPQQQQQQRGFQPPRQQQQRGFQPLRQQPQPQQQGVLVLGGAPQVTAPTDRRRLARLHERHVLPLKRQRRQQLAAAGFNHYTDGGGVWVSLRRGLMGAEAAALGLRPVGAGGRMCLCASLSCGTSLLTRPPFVTIPPGMQGGEEIGLDGETAGVKWEGMGTSEF